MYNVVSAIAKPIDGDGRWVSIDIGDMLISTLVSDYLDAYIILSNPFLDQNVCLHFADIRYKVGGEAITFNAFLAANGATTLPASTTLTTLNTRYARFKDAFLAGYSVTPVKPTISSTVTLPAGDKKWLYLEKSGVDFSLFAKSCLVSVNGFFHQTVEDPNGCYIREGMKSCLLANKNQVGILNFQKLGTLTQLPITSSMIYKQDSTQSYRNRMFVDLGIDITNKTVMLVLGGYLHLIDNKSFYQVGTTEVAIDFENIPLFDRYYESWKTIDLSSLPIQRTRNNASQIVVDDFLSDENLLAYVQLPQSFFVILDNPNVFKERGFVQTTPFPGQLIAFEDPEHLLINGVGKCAEYWPQWEDGQWALYVVDNFVYNRLYHTVDAMNQVCLSDACETDLTMENSYAFFLKIGADI
jgi:hypothetical protein